MNGRPRELGELLARTLALPTEGREAFLEREVKDPALRDELRELLADSSGLIEVDFQPATVDDRPRPTATEKRSLAGSTYGNIRIVEQLAEGGMGEVYLGFDEKLERQVAVKAIRDEWIADPGARGRFLREARILSRLDHPDICKIYDYVEERDTRLLVLELVTGRDLGSAIADGLGRDRALSIAERIAAVLVAAHAAGVVHRDLKPGNVMLTADGQVKVLDFGIARDFEGAQEAATTAPQNAAARRPTPAASAMTQAGMVLGTPRYMSPEQARGEAVTPASDLFSFGLLLRELLTGQPPYAPNVPVDELMARAAAGQVDPASVGRGRTLRRISTKTRPNASRRGASRVADSSTPGLDRTLAALINDLTALEPGARPTAADVVHRLRGIREAPRRRLRSLAIAGVVAAFVLGGIKYTLDLRAERNRALAARAAAEQARQEAETKGRESAEVVDYLVELFRVSDPGEARGATVTARELLDKGARRVRETLGDQPLVQARLADTIGTVYRELGLLDDSAALLELAISLRREHLGSQHLDLAHSLAALGITLWDRGDYPRAETMLREALAIREAILGVEHPLVAQALDGLGSVIEIQGRYAEAEPLALRALAIREAKLGPDSIEVASSLDDLAVLYFDQGQAAKAEPLARRALEVRRKVLGADSLEVATSANSLAISLATQGQLEPAVALLEEARAIRIKALGADEATVAQIQSNLGQIQLMRGELASAETLLLDALAIWEKRLGRMHPSTAITLTTLAELDELRGEPRRAEERYREAVAIFEAKQGKDHPNLLTPLPRLAAIAAADGRQAEASALYRRTLAICTAHRPPDHAQCRALSAALQALSAPGGG